MSEKKTRRSPGEGGVYAYQTKAGQRWRIKCVVTTLDGTRREVNRRGFTTKKAAQQALREVLAASDRGGHATMGVDVSEDSEQRGGGQLPKLPPREHDRESVERSEKQDRRQGWLSEAVSLIVDLMTSWR